MRSQVFIGGLTAVALAAGFGLAATAPASAAGDTLVVDAAASIRPVTHVGAGGLYAFADAATPPDAILKPLHLNTLTQPAPGVQQLGNGATVPTGDALKVATKVINSGAQQYVRMPDIYPNFPYKWVSWDDWLAKVKTMVQARLAATDSTNIAGWELWNEPDWTWDTAAAGAFNAAWVRTYQAVRALDTVTPIVGPSTSSYNHNYMSSFLTNAKANNALPNVISWHAWSASGMTADVADYRALEKTLGIGPLPISLNEYAWTDEVDVPGTVVQYLAQVERLGVHDAERPYWYESGTVNGLLYNNQPTGTYWLYKWYGDMVGNMVAVTRSGSQDGAASYDSTRKIVNVVFGGDSGNNTIQVKGLGNFGSSVKVTLSSTPNSGRKANVAAPTTISTATYSVSNGAISVPVTNQVAASGYQLVVTPAAGPTTSWQQVYQAENATVVNAQRLSASSASNGGYVGRIDGTGDARTDSFVDFTVNVPTAGTYSMAVRYANGGTATATQGLAYNGSAWSTISYPVTGSWGAFSASVSTSLTLKAGYNVIRLAKGAPRFAGGSGYAELDSITLTQ
jgi:hypothetical protein